jgi:glycogen debranching enzyme
MQEDNGFVGHMVFWKQVLPHRPSDVLQARPRLQSLRPHMSALIQPPLIAQAVKRIHEESEDRLFLCEMMPKLVRFHDWLAMNRSPDGDGLVCLISPFESGIDWKPSFDEVIGQRERRTPRNLFTSKLYWRAVCIDAWNFAHGYDLGRIFAKDAFLVKEVAFNTIYACDLRALAQLCELVGLGDRASQYGERAQLVGNSILNKMYDSETAAFYDIGAKTGKQLKVLTAMSFFPIILPEIPDAISRNMIERHFFDEKQFASPYPIPSVSISDPSFRAGESLAIWRGPTWPAVNWFLYKCLHRTGFVTAADRLYRSLRELIERSGFREYYNPFTGEGYGAKNFTWAGLIVDMS